MRRRLPPAVLLGALLLLASPPGAGAQPGATAPVHAEPVVADQVAAGRTFVGAIQPVRESVVGSEFGGYVLEYHAREGARVAEKQVLARLRAVSLDKELAAARALLSLREQERLELENGTRPETIEDLEAQVERADIEIERLAWELDAAQRLYERERISEDELRVARLAVARARAERRALAARLALAVKGAREEAIAQARAREQQQQAEVERLEDQLERYTIRAPFDGYVVEERAEVGQWLRVGDPVARIVALDEVELVVPVLEDHVSGLEVGAEVQIEIPALPDLEPEARQATLHAIVPEADPRARTFPVKFRLPNRRTGESVLIKAGMFGRVTLPVGEPRPALLVPKDAIVLGGPSPIVYVVGEDGVARPVPVEIGVAKDGMLAVRGEIEAGQLVVTRGNERLRPGMAVEVVGGGGAR